MISEIMAGGTNASDAHGLMRRSTLPSRLAIFGKRACEFFDEVLDPTAGFGNSHVQAVSALLGERAYGWRVHNPSACGPCTPKESSEPCCKRAKDAPEASVPLDLGLGCAGESRLAPTLQLRQLLRVWAMYSNRDYPLMCRVQPLLAGTDGKEAEQKTRTGSASSVP